MRKILFIIATITILLGCKKDEKSAEYWNDKVLQTYNEILSLSKNYTCADIPQLSINAFYATCPVNILIHKKDENKLGNLTKDYEYYYQKYRETSSNLSEPLCGTIHPFRIDYKDNKPYIIDINNISLEEINSELPKLYNEIKDYYKNTVCNSIDDWQGFALINEDTKEAIAGKKSDIAFHQKIQLLYQLHCVKLSLEGKECNLKLYKDKFILTCENGVASAKFE